MSERPERPEREGPPCGVLPRSAGQWLDWVDEADAHMDHQAAEIVHDRATIATLQTELSAALDEIERLESRITELEAGRESFARECMIEALSIAVTGEPGAEIKTEPTDLMDRAIAAVKAREGK